MTQNIIKTYNVNLKNLRKISFLLIYSIIVFYFLINGQGLFKEWNDSWTWNTIIYLVGVTLFLSIQEKLPDELESPINSHLVYFCLSFLICTVVFTVLYDYGVFFQDIAPMASNKIPAYFIFQLVVVCTSEEIIFRGVIYRYLRRYWYIPAIIVSSIIFAVFHWMAYSGNIGALMIAFLMGCVLALAVEKWNLGASIGIHFAWNSFVLGITLLF